MDSIKGAFRKVKEDIAFLRKEKELLRLNMAELKDELSFFSKELSKISGFLEELVEKKSSTGNGGVSTLRQTNQTSQLEIKADNKGFSPLSQQYRGVSIGNDGVPADRQTHQQTHRQTQNRQDSYNFPLDAINEPKKSALQLPENSIDNALEMLESLDTLKKEIRLKFKRLTEQELLVFSTIYQLDEEQGYSNHKILSQRLNLTESSIRDYVSRLIKKGIPVEKSRVNNKSIRLSISPNLKKIATLSAILQLRDL
jgi:predicted transcriptional regulator